MKQMNPTSQTWLPILKLEYKHEMEDNEHNELNFINKSTILILLYCGIFNLKYYMYTILTLL